MKRKTIVKHGQRMAKAVCGLLIGASVMQSCKDDVLTGQPSWLGNSIYERLQDDGIYTYTLRLIDDLGQKEVLGHTGSKTLFAADDNAYEEWFKNNSWGVSRYEDLTDAQKRLLLNNSMINNAYLIELMSNGKAQGDAATPEEGRTMRRETATSIYDSVYVMSWDEMPNTKAWADFRNRKKSIPIFKDATAAPMIHFLPAYMNYNRITDGDLAILTNHVATSAAEAWVNGKKVVERDITCKNGYIQKVSGVIESSPNMAEIIRTNPRMTMWSHLLDRYSAPYYTAAGTREYNRIYNNEDSVYVLRYYSKRSIDNNGTIGENSKAPNGDPVSALLSFDPGWNQYIDANSANNNDLHYDAGVMIVPTDSALQAWWNGEGRDLHDEYKEWDSIPDNTLVKLLNVNMLSTFSEAVPSKFGSVLNDAKETLGITPNDVVASYMGCNGVVYLTNKVFTPAEYSSVAYPALAHASTMNVIYWAIDQRNFLPYLLSMDSKYAMLLPTNNALLTYLDPGSYGKTATLKAQDGSDSLAVESPDIIEFYYDMTKSLSQRVQAQRFACTVDADGNLTKGERKQVNVAQKVIETMFDGLMDQLIIVIPDKTKTVEDYVAEGYHFFKTKGGSMIYAEKNAQDSLVFLGGWQLEHNKRGITSVESYPKANGTSYQLESQVPMGSQKSLYMTVRNHSEFNAFRNLLECDYAADLLKEKLSNKYNAGNYAIMNKNLTLFDNYNYTVYIPTNASIAKLQEDNLLPTIDELEKGDGDAVVDSICQAENWYSEDLVGNTSRENVQSKVKEVLKDIVVSFIRYHVQDHSVAIGMAPELDTDGNYESMKRNLETGRFYPLNVTYDAQSMTVKDATGRTHNVVTTNPELYNIICREYWFEGKDNAARQFMASGVVVHQIDSPLMFEDMQPWRNVVKEALSALKK